MISRVLLKRLSLGFEQVLLLGAVGDGVGLHNNFNIKDKVSYSPITLRGGSTGLVDEPMSASFVWIESFVA